MIVVKYRPDGMKSVVATGIDMQRFWELFRAKKKACDLSMKFRERRGEDAVVCVYRTGGNSFAVEDEALAAGCIEYVARPDGWPLDDGEPQ